MKKKVYNAPFWIMVFITLFVAVVNAAAYIFVTRVSGTNHVRKLHFNFLLALWPILLCAETVFYRMVRRRIKKSFAVWLHIFSTLVCFFLIPLTQGILNAILGRTLASPEYFRTVHTINQIGLFVFWSVFAMGHAFFITTIVNIFERKDTSGKDNEQPPGILDGILDEY